ncbi:MAG: mannose-6-phosphate isomerase [Bacteroidales bacterium]|jgi:mannose-6-phosphate isomerase|nr:mannose-6-phosphate isomerase [Bacteroidales bacterium]
MSELYPLKFEPVVKEKIWGGHSLAEQYGKNEDGLKNIGESWEISAVSDNLSVVSNGFLAGNNIEEIIEVYMGDITGDSVYDKFGKEFPLLIKLIESKDVLSIQVHPGDELSRKRHHAYGKTEMWYILGSENDSKIYTGFTEAVTRERYVEALNNGSLPDLLNVEEAVAGDAFFTPAGRIHAIGSGLVLVEIQQTSDITYRIYDWGRTGLDGKLRELHTDLALEAIDFTAAGPNKIRVEPEDNKTLNLVRSVYFNTNILKFNEIIEKDYNLIDSFVIYICTEGRFLINWNNSSEMVTKGETVLVPASVREITLEPEKETTLLEIYIDQNQLK